MRKLCKIISGGQTGADIAGIDAAISASIPYGGMIPLGRRNEIGSVDAKYVDFKESESPYYPVRTEENIKISDGTLIFINGALTKGSKLTFSLALKHHKPVFIINFNSDGFISDLIPSSSDVKAFIKKHNIQVLNIAGSRESTSPGIYNKTLNFMLEVLE